MACGLLISFVWLSANQYTGIKKNEKGKRKSCMVDDCIKGDKLCCNIGYLFQWLQIER